MIIKNLDISNLSREEYIYVIQSIIYWFKLDYENFTEIEKDILKNTIDKGIYKNDK